MIISVQKKKFKRNHVQCCMGSISAAAKLAIEGRQIFVDGFEDLCTTHCKSLKTRLQSSANLVNSSPLSFTNVTPVSVSCSNSTWLYMAENNWK